MNMKHKMAGVAVFALMLMPFAASAESYYTTQAGTMTQQQLIAYLQQLLAQLQAQQGGGYHGGTSTYGLTVQTTSVSNVSDDSASLYGNLQLGRAHSARVWFEYGQSTGFGQKTLTGTATSGGHYSFRADVVSLEEDTRYYFRAVAEDPAGRLAYGGTQSFVTTGDGRNDDDDDDDARPDVITDNADRENEDSAELNGEVDMNDFEDGHVFFVYGQDEDLVEEIEDEYETYSDIDEEDEDLQKVEVDSSLDDDDSYSEVVTSLDEDETYYFQICVEFENEDDDDEIICGGVEEFDTDEDGNDDDDDDNDEEPDVTTESAENVEDDEAELHGEVDMNDFDNGEVFFVFGQDEDMIEEVEDDFDSYSDVDEDGEDLEKVRVDSDLDDSSSYELRASGLDEDTDYYFQICVGYEDEDDDEVLMCGGVEEFTTED